MRGAYWIPSTKCGERVFLLRNFCPSKKKELISLHSLECFQSMLKSLFLCGVTCLAKASCNLYLFPSESDDIETTMDNKLQSKVNCTFNGVEIFPIKKKWSGDLYKMLKFLLFLWLLIDRMTTLSLRVLFLILHLWVFLFC